MLPSVSIVAIYYYYRARKLFFIFYRPTHGKNLSDLYTSWSMSAQPVPSVVYLWLSSD